MIDLNKADLIVSAVLFGFIGGCVGHHNESGIFISTVIGALSGIIMCIVLEIIKERVDEALTRNNGHHEP